MPIPLAEMPGVEVVIPVVMPVVTSGAEAAVLPLAETMVGAEVEEEMLEAAAAAEETVAVVCEYFFPKISKTVADAQKLRPGRPLRPRLSRQARWRWSHWRMLQLRRGWTQQGRLP